ncbi:MAG: hypothetical protein R3E64_13075 [Halioglobus sp.]
MLAKLPFGKKSPRALPMKRVSRKDDLTYNRQDFWATTSTSSQFRATHPHYAKNHWQGRGGGTGQRAF